ncbi:dynein regulator [Colletotrichum falcatum]|nr:dynein regulator [Colletotrichum falcatum]
MIAYLTSKNLPDAANAFREELQIGDSFDAATSNKYEGLLEKKWTSVVRLQKKMTELESRTATLQSEIDNATPTSLSRRNQDPASWLPRSPTRHTLQSHRHPITCVAFHPVFSPLASGSEDYTIKICVSGVRFIPLDTGGATGTPLVSASRDETLRIWDVSAGYCVKTLRGHADWVRDVCPTPDGRFLFFAGTDQTGWLWDISAANPEMKLVLVGHEHTAKCCTLAPPASYSHMATLAGLKKPPPAISSAGFMATGSRDKSIRLWDARGNCIKTLTGHDNWVRALVFRPGGKYLLSVSDAKRLRCRDLAQEQHVSSLGFYIDFHQAFTLLH